MKESYKIGDKVRVVVNLKKGYSSADAEILKNRIGKIIALKENHCLLDIEDEIENGPSGIYYDEIKPYIGHDFKWAIEQLKNNKKITRTSKAKWWYCYSNPQQNRLLQSATPGNLNQTKKEGYSCELSIMDFEADDWKLYEEPTLYEEAKNFGKDKYISVKEIKNSMGVFLEKIIDKEYDIDPKKLTWNEVQDIAEEVFGEELVYGK